MKCPTCDKEVSELDPELAMCSTCLYEPVLGRPAWRADDWSVCMVCGRPLTREADCSDYWDVCTLCANRKPLAPDYFRDWDYMTPLERTYAIKTAMRSMKDKSDD